MSNSAVPIIESLTGNEPIPLELPSGGQAFTTPNQILSLSGSAQVASYNSAGQSANIAPTTLYAVPAEGAGMYRVSAYAVVTQAATTSSTLPNIGITWTDYDSGVALSASTVTPTNPANAPGAFGPGSQIINAQAGTNIQFQTSNYASSGATAMTYAVHLKLEFLG